MAKGVYKRPPTKKQLDVLLYLMPGPIGAGLTYRQTMAVLNISHTSLFDRLRNFKRWHPVAYQNFKDIRRLMFRQHKGLRNAARITKIFDSNQIMEKF